MQKELKFQSELTCKRNDTDLTFQSNEVNVIVLPMPKITEHNKEIVCERKCQCGIPNLIYYFLFSKLI